MNLRDYERESIRRFVQQAADDGYFTGPVIDVGCGQQPYRDIVEGAGAIYYPYDRSAFGGNVSRADVGEWLPTYEAALSTQVIQYVADPRTFLLRIIDSLKAGGHLVMTYPTNWPEVEVTDLHRFTKAGMERLLTDCRFTIVRHEKRGSVWDPRFEVAAEKRVTATGEELVLGYGVVART